MPDGLVLVGLATGEVIVLLGALVLAAELVLLAELLVVIEVAPEDTEEAMEDAAEVAEDMILPELNGFIEVSIWQL